MHKYSELDKRINHLLDWMTEETGLGEIIDRIHHVAACRNAISKLGEDGLATLDGHANEARKVPQEIKKKAIQFRARGISYRDIARLLRISPGTAWTCVNEAVGTREDVIREAVGLGRKEYSK